MKDLGKASLLGIEIHRDKYPATFGLSQNAYIARVFKRFNMNSCSPRDTPIVKEDKFSKSQCTKNGS